MQRQQNPAWGLLPPQGCGWGWLRAPGTAPLPPPLHRELMPVGSTKQAQEGRGLFSTRKEKMALMSLLRTQTGAEWISKNPFLCITWKNNENTRPTALSLFICSYWITYWLISSFYLNWAIKYTQLCLLTPTSQHTPNGIKFSELWGNLLLPHSSLPRSSSKSPQNLPLQASPCSLPQRVLLSGLPRKPFQSPSP